MRRRRLLISPLIAFVALAILAAGIVTAATTPPAAERTASAEGPRYLQAAETGLDHSQAWWDSGNQWYRQMLPSTGNTSPATMWGIVHLFQATSAIAIADPTAAHKAAARSFAEGAERYWNPDLRPVPGYSPVPGSRGTHVHAWYDDAGWWGIAFYDAFRATGDRHYLDSAQRSLVFVDSGWDRRHGGIYWDTRHTFKASESLVGGAVTAAALYRETRARRYLVLAKRYIRWADAHILSRTGLYGGRESAAGPMPYVQGPMAEAFMLLCRATRQSAYCRRASDLMDRTARSFPKLTMGPQYDSMYIRSLLEVYRLDRNPRWYRIAAAAGDQAIRNAATPDGLYLKTWDGRRITTIGTKPGKLQTHAATTSVLAWLAAARPPAP